MSIHEAGGGINFTVNHTRNSDIKELESLLEHRIQRMVKNGTTCFEAKSGYGLETETEVKMLKVLHSVKSRTPVEMSVTYLAHSIPKGKTASEATSEILEETIPTIAKLQSEGKLKVDNIDVFLEKGVFENQDSKLILEV